MLVHVLFAYMQSVRVLNLKGMGPVGCFAHPLLGRRLSKQRVPKCLSMIKALKSSGSQIFASL